jgi:hypothetical protein
MQYCELRLESQAMMDKLQFLFRNYPEIRTREVAQMVEHLPENVKSCVQSPVLKKKKGRKFVYVDIYYSGKRVGNPHLDPQGVKTARELFTG